MHWLNERLAERDHKICFMAEYYLPDINKIPEITPAYTEIIITVISTSILQTRTGQRI